MKAFKYRVIPAILIFTLLFSLFGCGAKQGTEEPENTDTSVNTESETAENETSEKRTSEDPLEEALFRATDYICGSEDLTFGAEWESVAFYAWEGLALSDNWRETYGESVAEKAKECSGIFDARKLTDQAKVIIGVTAAGYNAADFEGYDLTLPLADYETAMLQGINGASWSLIALEFGGYEMPQNPDVAVQATEDMYIDYLLSRQLPDGGFAFSTTATKGDPDMTGMVLLALANYKDRADVAEAIDKAVGCLSEIQDADGGYTSYGMIAAESCAQVILALNKLGIPLDDERFIKGGNTIMDKLLEYRTEEGGFSHIMGEATNGVATEQAMIALISTLRVNAGMSDIFSIE